MFTGQVGFLVAIAIAIGVTVACGLVVGAGLILMSLLEAPRTRATK